jgi:2-haloalkanoic acid dehalogenase type II
MIRVVLFDLGSTLIYFDASWLEVIPRATLALCDTLRRHGLNLPREEFANRFQQRMFEYYQQRESEFIEYTTQRILQDLLAECGLGSISPQLLRRALDDFYATTQAHWQVEEDTHPTLTSLLEKGYRLGLISNASDALDVHTLVDKAALRNYFEQILISAEVGIRKPHPRIFQLALDFFGVKPAEAVMVGDTLGADILGANQIGMRSIWITRRANTPDNRDHLDTIQPTAAVNTLSEIPALLAGWSSSPVDSSA